jgi:hypothetical protein
MGGRSAAVFERRARLQLVEVALHRGPFAQQKALYSVRKGRVREPVRAAGGHWQQRTCHFVFALRAALEALHAVRYAPFERLVIARLEVQAIDALERAPIAPVGRNSWSFLPLDKVGQALIAIKLDAIGRPARSATKSSQASGICSACSWKNARVR